MASYHPASHPSRPSRTRAATAADGLAWLTSSWAATRAPATTTRAITQGTNAVRSPHDRFPAPEAARRARVVAAPSRGEPAYEAGRSEGGDVEMDVGPGLSKVGPEAAIAWRHIGVRMTAC